MKHLKFALVLFLILWSYGCDNVNIEPKNMEEISVVNINQDPLLKSLKQQNFDKIRSSSRSSGFVNRLNWNKVIKKINENGITTFTVPLFSKTSHVYEIIVLSYKEDIKGMNYYRFSLDKEWASQRKIGEQYDMLNYSGEVYMADLFSTTEITTLYSQGVPITDGKKNSNSRLYCDQELFLEWTEVCVGDDCNITEMSYEVVTTCYEDGSPEPSPTPPPPSDEPDPVGGTDPIPVPSLNDAASFHLSPINPEDDVSTPYDGMKAKDVNGTIFIYVSSIEAWVLPDLIFAFGSNSEDYVIEIYGSAKEKPTFNGEVLASIAVVAAVEPTPIGEVILVGAGITVGAIYLYEWADYYWADYFASAEYEAIRISLQECIDLFEDCENYTPDLDCAMCLHHCRSSGKWEHDGYKCY